VNSDDMDWSQVNYWNTSSIGAYVGQVMFAYEVGNCYINTRNLSLKPSNFHVPTLIALLFVTIAIYLMPMLFYITHTKNQYENMF
jgi:hypothetical protein